jgi:hypothetical protein
MVRRVEYKDMDFADKKRISQRETKLNKLMDSLNLPRYMGELYLYEFKRNIDKESDFLKATLAVEGLIDVED